MDLQLKDKPVVVLAGSAGLGRAVATAFAAEGAKVTLFSRGVEKLEATAEAIEAQTANRPDMFAGDVTRSEDLEKLFDHVSQRHGPVWAVFNNCGGPRPGPLMSLTDADWQSAFELTLLSYVRVLRLVHPIMQANGGGRVVNNASSSFRKAIDNLLLSNVFRMGVLGLTKTVAREFGRDGILVNTVGAGKFNTERVRSLDQSVADNLGIEYEEARKRSEQSIPLGRYGSTEEFARLVVFLCSGANTYVSGQAILADGAMVDAY